MLTPNEWKQLKKHAEAYKKYYFAGARNDWENWDWADDEHLAGIGEDMAKVILKASRRRRK
jgi:hypothetical protein